MNPNASTQSGTSTREDSDGPSRGFSAVAGGDAVAPKKNVKDGFFEWQEDEFKHGGVKQKQPYYVHAGVGHPMWVAGLFTECASDGDEGDGEAREPTSGVSTSRAAEGALRMVATREEPESSCLSGAPALAADSPSSGCRFAVPPLLAHARAAPP